jgi:molybdopterin adenylyltransferase
VIIKVAILTISDRSFSGTREDLSGPALISSVQNLGWQVVFKEIIPDDFETIKKTLLEYSSSDQVNLILTTGGTGYSSRDNTPEATLAVIKKRTSGLVEKIRMDSSKLNPHAILSRSEAGICHDCLIINLPGNPEGALESLAIIAPVLPHAISLLNSSPDTETNHKIK